MNEKHERDVKVHKSSGNVFADLDLPAAPEDMLRVEIALAIAATLRKRKLTQVAAGEIIGIDQAKISALLRGRVEGFSVERLMGFLIKLGRDIEIKISREHEGRVGELRVKAAA